jgi:polysaccharide biosynthesis/export protein VpsN
MVKHFLWAAFLAVLAASGGCSSTGSGQGNVVLLPPPGTPPADGHGPSMMAPAPVSSTAAPKATAQPSVAAPGRDFFNNPGSGAAPYRLKEGDPVVISLKGLPGQDQEIQDYVDENGYVNLPYINNVQAAGRTTTEVEQAVKKAYLDQQIYKYVTVIVVQPSRSYFLRGEIRQPGRFPLVSGTTIVQAIAAAGGFTEFADHGDVEVIRGTRRFKVNVSELEKHPERDKEIEAGDVIIVHRSFF